MSTPLAMSRRHVAGAESARGLLLTVLGEFVLPSGGSAWTSAFIEVLGRLGVEEKAVRQALMRAGTDGWLTSQRHGRRTRWALTDSARQELTEGAERIYGFAGTQTGWDRRWLLVLARVPETDRATRHVLRTRLPWAGLGSPAPGVWISTHADRADEASRVLADAGVPDAHVFIATHHTGGSLPGLVRQAWDLDAIETSYQSFLADFARRASLGRDPLARLVLLVHAWRRFPLIDPALPSELLPAHWSGARAAQLFRRQRAKWSADAATQWERLAAHDG
jgi:phenylacetic acid degradation operon negative regulatory protein